MSNNKPSKHLLKGDKVDEVKVLIARYILLKIEQKKNRR